MIHGARPCASHTNHGARCFYRAKYPVDAPSVCSVHYAFGERHPQPIEHAKAEHRSGVDSSTRGRLYAAIRALDSLLERESKR